MAGRQRQKVVVRPNSATRLANDTSPGGREARRRPAPREADYRALARFRYALRRFLHFSEAQARAAGISPNQYQLMLFVRGFPDLPTIADLAERLQIEHQSAVGLVDRSSRAGLVRRRPDAEDGRRVRVALTRSGAALLGRLVAAHTPEFRRLAGALFLPSAPQGRRS
jgi:DNA-binding MarR family transcriptional regulator